MKSLIFLVDENRNQLSALERAISSVEEFELAGMTSDGEECIRQLEGETCTCSGVGHDPAKERWVLCIRGNTQQKAAGGSYYLHILISQ